MKRIREIFETIEFPPNPAYTIWVKIKQLKETIGKFFYWGWKLRHSHDWDQSHLYELISWKIDSMRKYQIKYGITISSQNPKFSRRMKIAAESMKRLSKGNYDLDNHRFKKKEKEWSERWECFLHKFDKTDYEAQDNARKRDMETFCKILTKYSSHWWN